MPCVWQWLEGNIAQIWFTEDGMVVSATRPTCARLDHQLHQLAWLDNFAKLDMKTFGRAAPSAPMIGCRLSTETDRLDVTMLRRPRDAGAQNHGVAWPDLYSTDFLVNGQSLRALLGADKRDMAGCFMSLAVEGNWAEREEMLVGERQAELPNDRIGLFRCPLCGDLGCGAITFQLTVRGDRVSWSRFAFEVDWKVEGESDESRLDFEPYADIGPFEFDLAPYRAVLRKAVALVSAPMGDPRRPKR